MFIPFINLISSTFVRFKKMMSMYFSKKKHWSLISLLLILFVSQSQAQFVSCEQRKQAAQEEADLKKLELRNDTFSKKNLLILVEFWALLFCWMN